MEIKSTKQLLNQEDELAQLVSMQTVVRRKIVIAMGERYVQLLEKSLKLKILVEWRLVFMAKFRRVLSPAFVSILKLLIYLVCFPCKNETR